MNGFNMNAVRKPALEKVSSGAYESPEVRCMDIVLEKGFAQSATGEELNESDWV